MVERWTINDTALGDFISVVAASDYDAVAAVLLGLYEDNVDYLRLNNLGGYDNHWLKAAREVLGMTAAQRD